MSALDKVVADIGETLSGPDLIQLLDIIAERIILAEFPEPDIKEVTEDGETSKEAFCPHCHEQISDDGITAVDWSVRWTRSDAIYPETGTFEMVYDDPGEFEGLYYMHTECGQPINVDDFMELG